MSHTATAVPATAQRTSVDRIERARQRRRTLNRMKSSPTFLVGAGLLALIVLAALIGPLLVGHGPLAIEPSNRLQAPSGAHLFGTDTFGRDVLSRTLTGGRVSLEVGAAVAICSGLIGIVIGLYSAFFRGVDVVMMRLVDGLMAFPAILLAIALAASLGGSMATLILALTIVYSPRVARVARSAALSVKSETFIEALRSQGASTSRILWVNALPNIIPAIIIQITFVFADALLVEAALSFIGLGVPAPEPSWGNMLLEGKQVIFQAWWLILFPGLAILLLVLSINLLGDGLRDVLDPRYAGKTGRGAQ